MVFHAARFLFILASTNLKADATNTRRRTARWQSWKTRRDTREFLSAFWQCRNLKQVEKQILPQTRTDPCKELLLSGLHAARQIQNPEQGVIEMGSHDEFILRALRRSMTRSTLRLESGLTLLASVGSAAPFVGLFGTVWGIMNSFMSLGKMQQATLAVVAPGIAEALIATAIGLFAAIPAVIAYNRFSDKIDRLVVSYDNFREEFTALLERHYAAQRKNA